VAEIDAIRAHRERDDVSDGLVFDAVRVRLIEIGEAVKALPTELLASEPDLSWGQIAGPGSPTRSQPRTVSGIPPWRFGSIAVGVDRFTVARWARHTDAAFMERVYGHLWRDDHTGRDHRHAECYRHPDRRRTGPETVARRPGER